MLFYGVYIYIYMGELIEFIEPAFAPNSDLYLISFLGGGNSNIENTFTPNLGEDSNLDEYFSNGLKPPTSYLFPRKCFEFSHPNWELTSNDRLGD